MICNSQLWIMLANIARNTAAGDPPNPAADLLDHGHERIAEKHGPGLTAKPSCAPACEYVAIPLGSSSDVPVISPGPSRPSSRGLLGPTAGLRGLSSVGLWIFS